MPPAKGAKTSGCSPTGRSPRSACCNPPATPIALRRSGNELPSRVADNLYWLGRHVERAEGSVRLLRSIVVRLTSESEPANLPELSVAVAGFGRAGPNPAGIRRPCRGEGNAAARGRNRSPSSSIHQRSGSLRTTVDAMLHGGVDRPRPDLARQLAHSRTASSKISSPFPRLSESSSATS